ncbi:hypothetical protein ACQPXB_12465 [Amycolatopsis sp. CA-161197]|uniref:hypothetical protein n=1 Tax=Amycolatopsis sp. CA-161197 TaxID=3239922 RepID=UPI003D8C5461
MISQLESQVFPFYGERSLATCESTDLLRKWLSWLNERPKPLAGSYRKQLFDMVSSIWDAAVVDEEMTKNPCKSASITAPKATTQEVQVWPERRMWAIEASITPRFKPVVPIGAGLGLRQGETLAFSLDNVDRERMVYRCTRQQIVAKGVRKFKLPKGRKVREIPLGYGLLEELDAYAEEYPPVAVTLP